MNITRKLLVGLGGLLVFGGVGTSVAVAQTAPNPSTTAAPADSPASRTSPDTDHVQQGDQKGNDETAQPDRPDASDGQVGQSDHADAPGDPSDNHHDPDGVNVDHTPAGEKPETGPSAAED